MNEGLGSPVFFYYPPTPYWITSLLAPLCGFDPLGWRPLAWSACLGLALSGILSFLWLRLTIPNRPALLASLLYMLLPYHLRTDLYVRGAFAEFWAFAWIPFVLYAVHRLAVTGWNGIPLIAFSYALLITTHLPSTLVFSLVPLAYSLLIHPKGDRAVGLFRVVLGLTFGAGLGSIYLLPAMWMQGHVSMQELTADLYYAYSFFDAGSVPPLNVRTIVFKQEMFWIMLATVGTGATCSLLALQKGHALRAQVLFWTAVMLLAWFMMFSGSNFIWQVFERLQIIQFPWRFGTVVGIAATALLALACSALQRPLNWKQIVLLEGAYCGVVVWVFIFIAGIWPLHMQPFESRSIALTSSVDAPEYRPRWVHTDREKVIREFGNSTTTAPRVVFLNGTGTVHVLRWESRCITLRIQTQTSCTIRVRRFYFAGWSASQPAVNVSPSFPEGLIQVSLPAGYHMVVLKLTPSAPERLGATTSACTVGTLLLFSVIGARRRWLADSSQRRGAFPS